MSKKTFQKQVKKIRKFLVGYSEHVSDPDIVNKFDLLIETYSKHEQFSTLVKTLTHLSPNTFQDKNNLLNLFDFFMEFSDYDKEDCPKLFYLVQDCDRANDYVNREEYVPNLINPVLLEYKDSENLISVVNSFFHRDIKYMSCDDIRVQNTLLLYAKELPGTELCNEKVLLNFLSGCSDSTPKSYNILRVTHKLIDNFKEEEEFVDLVAFLSNSVLENAKEDLFKAGRSYVKVLEEFVGEYLENSKFNLNLLRINELPPICEHLDSMDFIKSTKTIHNLIDTFDAITNPFSNDSNLLNGLTDNFYSQLNSIIESEYSKDLSNFEVEETVNSWLTSLPIKNSLYQFCILPVFKNHDLNLDLTEKEINKLEELYLFSRETLVNSNNSEDDYHDIFGKNMADKLELDYYLSQLGLIFVQTIKEFTTEYSSIQEKRSLVYNWANDVMNMVKEKPELLFEYLSLEVGKR